MDHINKVIRLYSEKMPEFSVERDQLFRDMRSDLSLTGVEKMRVINRYDIFGIDEKELEKTRFIVFSEPTVDCFYENDPDLSDACYVLAVEALPGQFDQRADSAAQCIQIMTQREKPVVRFAKLFVFYGRLEEIEKAKISNYLINPVEARQAEMKMPDTLVDILFEPEDVELIEGFNRMDKDELSFLRSSMGLAMTQEDIEFTRDFFEKEKRDPTVTEIRVLDTYWSDHCRHTTFLTELTDVVIPNNADIAEEIQNTYDLYLQWRKELYDDRLQSKPICLMDIATIAAKILKKNGKLDDLDISDEINACSIRVNIETESGTEPYLLMFKNETHNHPTEIEPFGGAATCLGGAIRDPLSGRSYVYQAMRITGAADPTCPASDTLPGKLSQKKLVRTAASGYSSYGNQIGVATGQIEEIYHPGYRAKRMELGAVIAATPEKNVVRKTPKDSDVVILVGGRTGRDGIGGATGSSKAHDEESVLTCGAEVQKGNPPTERSLQRLFRMPQVAQMIIRCNDFGAGGVSVAIGELADGLDINLDAVPKKYAGLDGTELAISESQERMAVVVRPENKDAFIKWASIENLEAVEVARVTEEPRMVMKWRGKMIVDLPRSFINTNGAASFAQAKLCMPDMANPYFDMPLPTNQGQNFSSSLKAALSTLDACSRKGLIDRFDSTIGAGTVLMPLGGKYQMTPEEGMVAKVPTADYHAKTASIMTYGFDPYLSEWSPYHGAYHAVVESLLKISALGGDPLKSRLSFQEYFERLTDEEKWGKPALALLGAFKAQLDYGTASIGGKDSMSGTFNDIHVPPTLVSFAVATERVDQIVSSCLTAPGQKLYSISLSKDGHGIYKKDHVIRVFKNVHRMAQRGQIHAAGVAKSSGVAVKVLQMLFGNKLGFTFDDKVSFDTLFTRASGTLVLAVRDKNAVEKIEMLGGVFLGKTQSEPYVSWLTEKVSLEDALDAFESKLEPIFPTKTSLDHLDSQALSCPDTKGPQSILSPALLKNARPRVFIPVFPGTNTEFDAAHAFERAGADTDILVIRNLSSEAITESLEEMKKRINQSHILMLPGGFSGGDEPEGSAKFIVAALNNPGISEAVSNLLDNRDGLILGICNGFQALIKVGLLPFGKIQAPKADTPTLTFNKIGRHQSTYVSTRVVSNNSPWMTAVEHGDVFSVPISHGEGRFVANEDMLKSLYTDGLIATQYVDDINRPSMKTLFNPSGSYCSVEGLLSPDGRVLGKMGHNERQGVYVAQNIPGNKDQRLFESGVRYFMG